MASANGNGVGHLSPSTLPRKPQVDEALANLVAAAGQYSDAPDLEGHMARVEIIARAKSLIRSVVSPEMTPNYHGLNVGFYLPFCSPGEARRYPGI